MGPIFVNYHVLLLCWESWCGVLCCLQVCVVMSSGNGTFGIGNLNNVTYHLGEIDPLSVSAMYQNSIG